MPEMVTKNRNGTPKVEISILLPVRNGAQYLEECIKSVESQTFKSFEVVAVDDKSTDNSKAILQEWAAKKCNVRILCGSGSGLADALNLAIEAAQGRYLARMDADDIMDPNRLAHQHEWLDENPEISAVTSNFRVFGLTSRTMCVPPFETNEESLAALLLENWICHPAVMFRADVFKNLGLRYSGGRAQDFRLWAEMSTRKLKIGVCRRNLLLHRHHAAQESVSGQSEQLDQSVIALITIAGVLGIGAKSQIAKALFRPQMSVLSLEEVTGLLSYAGEIAQFLKSARTRMLLVKRVAQALSQFGIPMIGKYMKFGFSLHWITAFLAFCFVPLFLFRTANALVFRRQTG